MQIILFYHFWDTDTAPQNQCTAGVIKLYTQEQKNSILTAILDTQEAVYCTPHSHKKMVLPPK